MLVLVIIMCHNYGTVIRALRSPSELDMFCRIDCRQSVSALYFSNIMTNRSIHNDNTMYRKSAGDSLGDTQRSTCRLLTGSQHVIMTTSERWDANSKSAMTDIMCDNDAD